MDEVQPFAFVLMPFDESFEDVYNLGIKEPANTLGIRAERVDEQIYKEGILDRIFNQINAADIVIADMTAKNPNVFYEVGYAHAKDKLCILLTSDADDIPFDLKHRRHIVYGGSIKTLRQQLLAELEWSKDQIENTRLSQIQVSMKECNGDLTTTKYSATGSINFRIDLNNYSDRPSSEIEAVYFYTRSGWKIYQNDTECPSTESDIPLLLVRHFLNAPIRRLNRNTWAQIKFSAKKVLAYSWNGDEIKDTYRISGRSILRIVTSDGEFDYDFPIDVELEEIPF